MRHLDAETLLMIVEGKLPPRVLVQVMCEHLRELCPECREAMEVLPGELGLSGESGERFLEIMVADDDLAAMEPFPGSAGTAHAGTAHADGAEPCEGPSPYNQAFKAAALVAQRKVDDIETERTEARRDLEELLAMEPADWTSRVRNAYTRFRSRALAERMLACSADLARQDPEKGRQMAELVEDVVARIPGSSGQTWSDELKVRAKARQANALRVAGLLAKADAVFRDIHNFLRQESLELEDLPSEVASLEATLRFDQERVDEALELHSIAIRLAQVAGDTLSLGSYLVSRAESFRRCERVEEAQRDLNAALKILSPEDNAHLYACAIGSQILVHHEAGQAREAAEVFSRYRSYLETHEEEWIRIKAVSLRGAVNWGLGRMEEAEACLIEARDRMIAGDQIFSASSLSLDLADIYLATGQSSKLKDLARDLVSLFQSAPYQHQQGATVALTLFHQASLAERVTREAIRSLRRTLERAQTDARRSAFLPY